MGGLSLLQGIFTTQGSNQGLLHWGRILYHLSYQGSYIGRGALVTEGPPLGSLGRPSHCGLFCRVPLLGQLLLWSARARTASARQEPLRLADLTQGAWAGAVPPVPLAPEPGCRVASCCSGQAAVAGEGDPAGHPWAPAASAPPAKPGRPAAGVHPAPNMTVLSGCCWLPF